jgi:hypothetical protein
MDRGLSPSKQDHELFEFYSAKVAELALATQDGRLQARDVDRS